VQTCAVVIIAGVDFGLLVLASIEPGAGPAQDHLPTGEPRNSETQHLDDTFFPLQQLVACLYLQAVGAALLVPLRSGQSRRQRPLWQQQDLRALAKHVEARLVVHVTLVGVPLFTEQERPIQCKQERRDDKIEDSFLSKRLRSFVRH